MEIQCRVGTRGPLTGPNYNIAHWVGEVIADGDELEYIKVTFPTIPTVNKSVVRYFGDFAKLIAANLS